MKIVDMHCDTISREGLSEKGLRKNDFQIDLYKMKEAGYLLQNFALFVDYGTSQNPVADGLRLADIFHQEMGKNPDLIRPVTTYEEILKNKEEGLMSALLTLEEGAICSGDVRILHSFYRLGVRMITLTWNHPNQIGQPNIYKESSSLYGEPNMTGLSENGLAFLAEMERLGVIIDVSHLSDGGFYDVLHHTKKPFVASHSNARTLGPHCRNLTDDMIRQMGNRGCVTGLNYYGAFLGELKTRMEEPFSSAKAIARHARYIADLGGIQVLGLGSDFDGFDSPCEISDCSNIHLLEHALKQEHFTSSDIDKIFSENVLRVYKELL